MSLSQLPTAYVHPINLCNSWGLGLFWPCTTALDAAEALARVSNKLPFFVCVSCIVLEAFSLPTRGFRHRAKHSSQPLSLINNKAYCIAQKKYIQYPMYVYMLQPRSPGNKLTQKDNADSGVQFITPAGPRQSLLLAKDPDQFLWKPHIS